MKAQQPPSGEHYTPHDVVASAREALGGQIDLDPASSALANKVIGAAQYFDPSTNGYLQAWVGHIFVNPPGGYCDDAGLTLSKSTNQSCVRDGSCGQPPGHTHTGRHPSVKRWWHKLIYEYEQGRVASAVFVGLSIDVAQHCQTFREWRRPLDFPFCVPASRICFLRKVGTDLEPGASPTHSNIIVYLPERGPGRGASIRRFQAAFASIGQVVIPMAWATEVAA